MPPPLRLLLRVRPWRRSWYSTARSTKTNTLALDRPCADPRCHSSLQSRGVSTECSEASTRPPNRTATDSEADRTRIVATSVPSTAILGILRETYDPWERRVPLTPEQVQTYLQTYPGTNTQVWVQPCTRRAYPNHLYEAAGATIREDLSHADLLLGVKRPRIDDLLPHHTYLGFSHALKGQVENRAFLRACLDQQIQWIDYERMVDTASAGRRRLGFGRYAGLAGALDTLSVLGQLLLVDRGWSTPFLCIPRAYAHITLDDAITSVRRVGTLLADEGLPTSDPLVVALTGKGGCVHNGAMEILQQLPHEVVAVADLPYLRAEAAAAATTTASAMGEEDGGAPPHHRQRQIYLVPVSTAEAYRRVDGAPFDRTDYDRHSSQYRSALVDTLLPYCDVLLHAAYWDARYPRLVTKHRLRKLCNANGEKPDHPRLLLVSDLSCDVRGSMEFLERTTTIESPCFQYDPHLQHEVPATGHHHHRRGTVTVMGVDILPAELPRDSSEHFGKAVLQLLPELMAALRREAIPHDNMTARRRGVDPHQLEPGLYQSCITTDDGQLMPSYQYLDPLLQQQPLPLRSSNTSTMTLSFKGHLFDSGLINQILNVVEQQQGDVQVEECLVPTLIGSNLSGKSTALLRISAPGGMASLRAIEQRIRALVDAWPKADTAVERMEPADDCATTATTTSSRIHIEAQPRTQRVLVLGAGHVSEALVERLGRSDRIQVTVVSDHEADARRTASAARHGRHVAVDVCQDPHQLSALVEDSDLVVSLLPAPLHIPVALECILQNTDLVTASYESEEMRKLEKRAKSAGIAILNEVGLDPGLDHMSAVKIVDDIKLRGGAISTFSSVCGGLPAPDASHNPLRYKFSWNPRGLIRACQNDARFRLDGQVREIRGHELLRAASPFAEEWPDLGLECLPNRDALWYEDAYDIEGARTVFRGTLRYQGFSALMNVFQSMGLFDSQPVADDSWDEVLYRLRMQRGGFDGLRDFVEACADEDMHLADRAMEALEWLGLSQCRPVTRKEQLVDELSRLLESKMRFAPGERDMVIMRHRVEAVFDDGTEERHISRLQVFGDASVSAMAKTVGSTAAAAAELILEGGLRDQRGLLLPTVEQIYLPVLEKVAQDGIIFEERVYIEPSRTLQEA